MYPETISLICGKIGNKDMYKKLLVASVILGLAFLSLWSQIQIKDLRNEQVEINKVIEKNNEDKKAQKKTLLDQVLENSEDRGRFVVQENQYAETLNSESQPDINNAFEEKCQDEQTTYNSCLIKYNTELLEYQNCQAGEKTFGCSLSSSQLINTCEVNISSWCRKQILGHY